MNKVCIFIISGFVAVGAWCSVVQITPINTAEAIFEPLFNGSYLKTFQKDCTFNSGKFVYGYGCSYSQRVNKGMAVVEFYKNYADLPLSGYDKLIVFLAYGAKGQKVSLSIDTDKGPLKTAATIKSKACYELQLDLKGAKKLKKLQLRFSRNQAVSGTIWWIGLQNSKKLNDEVKYYENLGKLDWRLLLKPENYKPAFKLSYNVLFKKGEGNKYRKYILDNPELLQSVKKYEKLIKELPAPGTFLTPYVRNNTNYVNARRRNLEKLKKYNEKQDQRYSIKLRYRGANAATLGYVLKDEQLLRIAARWAVIQCMRKHWGARGINLDAPGVSSPAGGSFGQDSMLLQLATVLDFAGEMFTPAGKTYILRQMALKGLGEINYCFWFRSFNYVSNQGLAFSSGRLAAYLIMQKEFKHIKRYTNIAIEDINTVVCKIFAADGGYLESVSYMNYSIGLMIPIYLYYSNYTGRKLSSLMPENVLKSAAFVDAIASTAHRGCIPVGQSASYSCYPQVIAFMAKLLPDSMWVNFWNQLQPAHKQLDVVLNPKYFSLLQNIPIKNVDYRTFNLIKSCGLASSVRKIKGQLVKILFVGFGYHVGKRHADIGSFVLEFAGDVFAMSMPVHSGFYKNIDFLNMLVPSGKDKFPKPIYYSKLWNQLFINDLAPKASGNEKSFAAKIDVLGKTWDQKYFKKWSRKIDSPTPEEFIITDKYEVGDNATGVNFYWQTALDVKLEKKAVTITGKKGIAVITAPDDCSIAIEDYIPSSNILRQMGLPASHKCHKIIIHREGKSGKLEIKVKLSVICTGKKINP